METWTEAQWVEVENLIDSCEEIGEALREARAARARLQAQERLLSDLCAATGRLLATLGGRYVTGMDPSKATIRVACTASSDRNVQDTFPAHGAQQGTPQPQGPALHADPVRPSRSTRRPRPGTPRAQSRTLLPGPDFDGAEMRRRRRERKVTQTALARAVGVSGPYISQIESGTHRPSPELARKLERFLAIINLAKVP